MDWSSWCARFANLRHPLINPLIDYGVADRDHLFEAYAVQDPLRCGGAAAQRLFAHAVRFLRAHEIELERPRAAVALRPIENGAAVRPRPVGVVLQRRAVYDAIADALDTARPGGACALAIEGEWASGLRTLQLVAARTARLKGYVPMSPRCTPQRPVDRRPLQRTARLRDRCRWRDGDAVDRGAREPAGRGKRSPSRVAPVPAFERRCAALSDADRSDGNRRHERHDLHRLRAGPESRGTVHRGPPRRRTSRPLPRLASGRTPPNLCAAPR